MLGAKELNLNTMVLVQHKGSIRPSKYSSHMIIYIVNFLVYERFLYFWTAKFKISKELEINTNYIV